MNRQGELERITQNVAMRDSFFNLEPEKVSEWYKAMMQFIKIIYDESVEFKTRPGDILSVSNVRLLHGRAGFTDTGANARHIVSINLDWDQVYSRWRVLVNSKQDERKLNARN